MDPESAAAKPYLNGKNTKLFAEQPGFVIKSNETDQLKNTEETIEVYDINDSKLPHKRSKKKMRKPIREEDFITHGLIETSQETCRKRLRRQTSYKSINFSQLTAEA